MFTQSILLLLLTLNTISVHSVCPFFSIGTPPSNDDPLVPSEALYNDALINLDVKEVFEDLLDIMTDSQDCWPADEFDGIQSYGPLFIRLAWHCAGSYIESGGLGGCAGGRIRFQPESAWADNVNLDKARALLGEIKTKFGDSLSWGDLIIFAGTAAIHSMGGPVTEICWGRMDDSDGSASEALAVREGEIYVNPQGPNGEPVPSASAAEIRTIFSKMGMDDRETVALIGGGHAFGKAHGACSLGPGPGPDQQPENPWPGLCGTGMGVDTFTSGFEGYWTSSPFEWDNEYFQILDDSDYTVELSSGGKWQWRSTQNEDLIMFTSDLALYADEDYRQYVDEFANDLDALNEAFGAAWSKLVTRGAETGWSANKQCVDAAFIFDEIAADTESEDTNDEDTDYEDEQDTESADTDDEDEEVEDTDTESEDTDDGEEETEDTDTGSEDTDDEEEEVEDTESADDDDDGISVPPPFVVISGGSDTQTEGVVTGRDVIVQPVKKAPATNSNYW